MSQVHLVLYLIQFLVTRQVREHAADEHVHTLLFARLLPRISDRIHVFVALPSPLIHASSFS
jgi:hypothetical protein